MSTSIHGHQGDVFFIRRDQVPEGAQPLPIENGLIIYALGETTGHKHATIATPDIRWFGVAEDRFVASDLPIQVTHDEHAPIILEPGCWQVVIQVEYQRGRIQRVID